MRRDVAEAIGRMRTALLARYLGGVAKSCGEACHAVRSPDSEARIYVRSLQEAVLCVQAISPVLETLSLLDEAAPEITAERLPKGAIYAIECKNNSAIVFYLEAPTDPTGSVGTGEGD